MNKRRLLCLLLTLVLVFGLVAVPGAIPTASAAGNAATLTVDLDPDANTGEIIHGAAGFLYGVSSEDVPTTNTIVPLKSKILVTKGALGTEHPYGDALDVAKTFLESGGQQVQMYNSNYYGVFGVTATPEQYANDLKTYICPAVVEWKKAWKAEHTGDGLGQTTNIDEAVVYVPINEGTPAGSNFQESWKLYYEAIKSVDENANIAGPNSAGYGWQFTWGQSMESYIQFSADNNCMPDVITWHELQTNCLNDMQYHMDDFREIWYNRTDWTKYNEANGTSGIPEIPQICINEYAEMEYCGVPGRLVNWIARLEDEKITGCLPFWHQANNLNDLTASANEGNGAWWLYQWYGNMSGTTQPVSTSSGYDQLYGVSTMDEAKKLSTTLLGGWTGEVTVRLENVTDTDTFSDAVCVDVTVEEAVYSGFHSPVTETPTVISGTYPVNDDGSVTITIPDTLFESAYKVTVSQSTAAEANLPVLLGSSGTVYEAEKAQLSGGASATAAGSNPSYYMSGSGNRAADMPSGASLTYTIDVPVDGHYRLDFVYGNGQGSVRNDMYAHNPVNAVQTFSVDGGEAASVMMESTLFQTMTGTKTLYYDLRAGTHTITISTSEAVRIDSGMLLHDFLRVRYAAAYGEDMAFHRVYEAELADFNKLLNHSSSTVTTETALPGYTGSGYVTGLSGRSVEQGGGIRYTIVVDNSGLYNLTLRYQSQAAGSANLYVGNTATTLNRLNKTVSLTAGSSWQTVTASIYLQKGINVVDLDATVDAAVDYLRVREITGQTHSTTIEAEDATLSEGVTVATSEGASGGQYVVGMPGSYDPENRQYLEFTYNAPSAGKYQMQVFHSNEDLAGSHSYNIKAIDKYAVVEVDGQSDSPVWSLADTGEEDPLAVYYFVDCGDHDPSTVSQGDSFGTLNPACTDQLYGADASTGYNWGVVMETDGEESLGYGGGSEAQSENDKAVYTTYQRALSNSQDDLLDGKPKTATFRYAHGQDTAGISPRYISYAFELEPGTYDVSVCMGTRSDWYNNSKNPLVTLSADGVDAVSQQYTVPDGSTQVKTMTIDLSKATPNESGKVKLSVKATSNDATIQMNYILITEKAPEVSGAESLVTLPGGVKVQGGTAVPEDVYVGPLAQDVTTFLDYRNLKNSTDRYFFINTFSDDTFREKTITLDLKQGGNKIRIYNDNSWNVTFGGSTATPGLEALPNYTPNFDKFVITPMAISMPVEQTGAYLVEVSTNAGGRAWTDRTQVEMGGSYTLHIVSEGQAPTVTVNGVEQTGVTSAGDGSYTLTVSGVNADQQVGVYFILDEAALAALCDEASALEAEDYTSNSWTALTAALDAAKDALGTGASAIELQMLHEALRDALDALVESVPGLTYFVDCGDHDPATVTGLEDDFGSHNSVTDQIYGDDAVTNYRWGVVMERGEEQELGWEGGSLVQSEHDEAVYTTYQRALSNSAADLADGQDKAATLRYAHDQGFFPKYVSYAFELEPGEYDVTVCMNNTWGNATNPTVTLAADDVEAVTQAYNVKTQRTHTMTIDLSEAAVNGRGYVELSVKATTTTDATIQMSYITIVRTDSEPEAPEPETYTIAATQAEGGTIAPASAQVEEGGSETFNVTAAEGYELTDVKVDGKSVGAVTSYTFENVTADHTITAVFTEKTEVPEELEELGEILEAKDFAVEQVKLNSTVNARTYLEAYLETMLPENVTAAINSVSFTAAKAGTLLQPKGVNGAYVFTVTLTDGTDTYTTGEITLVIEATEYQPTVLPILPGVGDSGTTDKPVVQTEFYDVAYPSWYYDAVAYVCENGYMNGVAEGCFDPDGSVTRAMVWTVLARMDSVNTEGGSTWYANAQQWAVETGVSDGTDPMGSITREQLAAMLYRFEGSPAVNGNLNAYPDANTVSDWARDAMVWATETGLINGINGQLSPKTGATRAQLSAELMRMLES